jgi:hypothetical protein
MAVQVAGLDSWVHHSRVKGLNSSDNVTSPPPDPELEIASFSCEPLDGLKLLFKKKTPTDTDKLSILPNQSIHSAYNYFKK